MPKRAMNLGARAAEQCVVHGHHQRRSGGQQHLNDHGGQGQPDLVGAPHRGRKEAVGTVMRPRPLQTGADEHPADGMRAGLGDTLHDQRDEGDEDRGAKAGPEGRQQPPQAGRYTHAWKHQREPRFTRVRSCHPLMLPRLHPKVTHPTHRTPAPKCESRVCRVRPARGAAPKAKIRRTGRRTADSHLGVRQVALLRRAATEDSVALRQWFPLRGAACPVADPNEASRS